MSPLRTFRVRDATHQGAAGWGRVCVCVEKVELCKIKANMKYTKV